MKTGTKSESGSAIIVMIIVSAAIFATLASFLKLASGQTSQVSRSQTWNSIIPICEAGIEEALAHMNDSAIGTNYATDTWTVSGNAFTLSRDFGGGNYVVNISTDSLPNVTARGYLTLRTGERLSRAVQITTTRWSTGMKGIVSKNNLTMTSNTQIDSFDSEDARYSTRGHYDPAKHKDGGYAASVNGNVTGATIYGSVGTGPTGTASGNVGDFAWVAGNTGIQPGHYGNDLNLAFPVVQVPFTSGAYSPDGGSLTLTNFDYWSTMITTDFYPTNALSPITTNDFGSMTVTNYPPVTVLASTIVTNTTPIKDKNAPAAGTYMNLVIKGAFYYYDLITSYTYPARTYTYSTTAASNTTTTDYYQWVLSESRYQMSELKMSGSQKMIVTGNTTLYVTGDFSMTGNSKIIIAPGASLKMFVAGSTSMAGNGVFNYTLDASKFMYYGLPSNTSISITGNAAFTGTIYAPQADMQLGGGGNDIYDVVGAVMAKTVTMNGHFNFHYDERLGRSPVQAKFTVASWAEVTWSVP